MVVKKGNNTVNAVKNIKIPKWLDDLITKKMFLYLMAFVLVAGAIYISPIGVALTKAFSSTSDGPPPVTPTPTIMPTTTGTPKATPTPTAMETKQAFKIPTDALVMTRGSVSHKYPINAYPTSVYLENAFTLFTNIRITDTEVTGTVIDTRTGKTSKGGIELGIGFIKEGEEGEEGVGDITIYRPYPFKIAREPKTFGANKVVFSS